MNQGENIMAGLAAKAADQSEQFPTREPNSSHGREGFAVFCITYALMKIQEVPLTNPSNRNSTVPVN
jgi:hypothetical protein